MRPRGMLMGKGYIGLWRMNTLLFISFLLEGGWWTVDGHTQRADSTKLSRVCSYSKVSALSRCVICVIWICRPSMMIVPDRC